MLIDQAEQIGNRLDTVNNEPKWTIPVLDSASEHFGKTGNTLVWNRRAGFQCGVAQQGKQQVQSP